MCCLAFFCGRCQQTCCPELGQREQRWVNTALRLCHSVSSYPPPFSSRLSVAYWRICGPQNQWVPGFISQIPRWKETGSPYCAQPSAHRLSGPHFTTALIKQRQRTYTPITAVSQTHPSSRRSVTEGTFFKPTSSGLRLGSRDTDQP